MHYDSQSTKDVLWGKTWKAQNQNIQVVIDRLRKKKKTAVLICWVSCSVLVRPDVPSGHYSEGEAITSSSVGD